MGEKAKRVDEDMLGDERTSSKPRAEGNLTDSEDEIDSKDYMVVSNMLWI